MEKLNLVLPVFFIVIFFSCSNFLDKYNDSINKVYAPQFNYSTGSYNYDLEIEITSETDGAQIYYTTDGTEPGTNSVQYTAPIPVTGVGTITTINAIAVRNDMFDSDVATAIFTRTGEIANNAVGATNSTDLRTLDYTPGNDNTIFVSKTGNDISGTGKAEDPVASINKAITLCDAQYQKVMILDSGIYEEKGFEFTGDFRRLYAALGEMPIVSLYQNNDYLTVSEIKSDTTFHTGSTYDTSPCILTNSNVFIAYIDGSDGRGKYVILNSSDWTEEKSETIFHDASTGDVTACMLDNGNVFIAYVDGSDNWGKYLVLNSTDWIEERSETVFNDAITSGWISSCILANGNVFIAFIDYDNQSKFIVLNSGNWSVEQAKTVFKDLHTSRLTSVTLPDGNVLIAYTDDTDGLRGKYLIINSIDWTVETSEIVFHDDITFHKEAVILPNNNIFIAYEEDSIDHWSKFIILNSADLSIVKTETLLRDSMTPFLSATVLADGNILAVNGSGPGNYIIVGPSLHHITASVDAVLNGIIFTSTDKAYLETYINITGGNLTAKWCDFKDNISSTSNTECTTIYTENELNMSNCRVFNNDYGIFAICNKAQINNSQFYNNSGYALQISGSAAVNSDIAVNHCDFFKNQEGVRLQGNSGINEIIKNSIFHENTTYGVYADNVVTVNHSIITDLVQNTDTGTGIINSDPLYINEGLSDPNDVDLHLQTTLMGFPADSTAIDLADDNRNAGAYDVSYFDD